MVCAKRRKRRFLTRATLLHGLAEDYDKPFAGSPMHEVVFTDKRQSRKGVHTLDIAKRLIDYGFHPMTIYFPLIVQGAMLIEPTESVGRQELDQFIEAMKSIASEAVENPELVLNAPHNTRIGRLDEAAAARKPVLRWKPVGAALRPPVRCQRRGYAVPPLDYFPELSLTRDAQPDAR